MLLAGGGIGITPVMGMLKDVYNYNLNSTERILSNRIKTLYFLWVMPNLKDYDLFKTEIDAIATIAKNDNNKIFPKLKLFIYITREKNKLNEPFYSGRPKMKNLFDTMLNDHDKNVPGLVFACGPSPLVSELWDNSIQVSAKGRRMDFHHEVFDF